jgi:uncharacterized protein YoxC
VDTVLALAQTVALLSLAAVCIYLIVVLVRLKSVLVQAERDLKEISVRLIPVLDNTEFITAHVKTITESVEDQVHSVRDSITSIKRVADDVLELERKVQEKIEGPILDTVAYTSAVVSGVRAFVARLRS